MALKKPLTPLESATLATITDTYHESDGWLDLTRVCSRTGRHLVDVRQSVARLVRYGLIVVDAEAPNTDRWLKFEFPENVAN
jgi:predicted transcriptional regulator